MNTLTVGGLTISRDSLGTVTISVPGDDGRVTTTLVDAERALIHELTREDR